MFFKHCDYLSPTITLYYKGFSSHTSIISGLISIFAIIFIINIAIYFSLDLIQRKNPKSFYFNIFAEDAGIFEIKDSSLFHFLNVVGNEKGKNTYEKFDFVDFAVFNIVATQSYIGNFLKVSNKLKVIDHWLYGYCDKKDIYNNDIKDLVIYDFFEKSACIKKYYNSTKGEYYKIGDPEFVWPSIEHGTFNELNKLYGIYIQKCDNKTIKHILGNDYQCKNDEEINNYFEYPNGSRIIQFYFTNNYINVLNYEKPNNKFFYRIENSLNKDQYTINNINIKPALIRTENGLIFDNINNETSYIFERNDVSNTDRKGEKIYMGYCFFF